MDLSDTDRYLRMLGGSVEGAERSRIAGREAGSVCVVGGETWIRSTLNLDKSSRVVHLHCIHARLASIELSAGERGTVLARTRMALEMRRLLAA